MASDGILDRTYSHEIQSDCGCLHAHKAHRGRLERVVMRPHRNECGKSETDDVLYRILECTLNLSPQESEVYLALQKYPNTGVNELAEFTGKNVSGLNRTLKSLMKKGLVRRECRILKHGGYKYFYFPIPLEEIIPDIRDMIRSWIMELDSMVESFSLKLEEKTVLRKFEVKYTGGIKDATSLELRQ